MIRILSCFKNDDDKLVFDIKFDEFELELFQKEFKVSKDNPMYESYSIKENNIPFIKTVLPSAININWNFIDYSYFVETIEN